MKKLISMMLSFVMLFQLTACGGSGENSDTPQTNSIPNTVLGENNVPVKQQENGDIIPDTDDFYESQQTVFAELNEKSIGANKELVATLKNDAPAIQYELKEEDHDYFFVLEVNEEDSWTPFISGKETTFTVSDERLIEY